MIAVLIVALAALVPPSSPTPPADVPAEPQHFLSCPHRTGGSAVVIVPTTASVAMPSGSLEVGDEIAVIGPDGACAGAGVWDGDGLAVTVWEDDPFTPERDGLLAGDPLTFATYDASEGVAHTFAAVEYEPVYGEGGQYSRDALFVLSTTQPSSTTSAPEAAFALGQTFPNPVRDRATIPFSLAERAAATVEVFDAIGRLVARPLDAQVDAGSHSIDVDLAGLAPGIYVYRLAADGQVRQRTLTVAR